MSGYDWDNGKSKKAVEAEEKGMLKAGQMANILETLAK